MLMGLGQESDREGEVVSWEAASSAPGRVAMNCQKAPFAAIAQDFGRQGLHIMTASMRLVHEVCGFGHFTVGGAGWPPESPRNRLGWGPPETISSPLRGITSRCELADPR